MRDNKTTRLLFGFGSVVLALALTSAIVAATGNNPFIAYKNILQGAAGSANVAANVLVSWVPLLLATSGVLFTFTVGLWNIGIEGQITLGAIFSVWAMRGLQAGAMAPGAIIALSILAGVAGGMLWALFAGALKTFGGVNEIFGGLGLNFVATALNLWLIFGPWKRPGVASMSGTLPFDPKLWMPTLSPQSRLAPIPLAAALCVVALTFILLRGTYFGLKLRAVGKNPKSAYLLGIPTWQHMMLSFAICGAFAGLAGAVQVSAVYHRLIPSISSGYGYAGLTVAMLVNYSPIFAAPVALFFAALNVGSIQLPIVLRLDSSLAGVIQGFLVLFVLIGNGVRIRLLGKKKGSI
ncbi:MAG TPA: ABC transporter permease [Rectinemataceae bacterium]|nr:ABC transporter permease [Rectinemataceae bacterium]